MNRLKQNGMSNKIFIDSSLLVEYTKGNQTELLEHLTGLPENFTLCLNDIVLSEHTFYFLAHKGGKAPYTLKRNESIGYILKSHNIHKLLPLFEVITSPKVYPLYLELMQQYNLLPNDALILATCILNDIQLLASFDTDFTEACQNEGVRLIAHLSDLS